MIALAEYGATEGESTPAPTVWPGRETALPPPDTGIRVVFFAHPRCPCTRASLSELARLLTRAGWRVPVEAVFYRPDSEADSWAHSDLWEQAARIPGVTLRTDPGGVEARRGDSEPGPLGT
ncbi:MAG: hypothetical protein JKY65_06220 [Planctomycetes bacterium]|nr:hypothetical protein [Planctomycetota bacterium]